MINKYKIIIILLLISNIFGFDYRISQSEIESIAAKDIYEILNTIPSLYGFTYSKTGQKIEFKKNGYLKYDNYIYIDSILVSDPFFKNYDFSQISIDNIDNLKVSDQNNGIGGLRIDISTKVSHTDEPYSEVLYRDAFFNHRNLSFMVAQNFSANYKFSFFADITDYMDHREYSDNFDNPYQRQIYNFKVTAKDIYGFRTKFNYNFFQSNLHEFSNDTLFNIIRNHRFGAEFFRDSILSKNLNNKTSFSYENNDQRKRDSLNYNRYIISNEISGIYNNLDWHNKTEYIFNSYKVILDDHILTNTISCISNLDFASLKSDYYFKYSSRYRSSWRGHFSIFGDFQKNYKYESNLSYYSGYENIQYDTLQSKTFAGDFLITKKWDLNYLKFKLFSGMNFVKYFKLKSSDLYFMENTNNMVGENLQKFFSGGFSLKISNFDFLSNLSYSLDDDYYIYNPKITIHSAFVFKNKYFNDDLSVVFRVDHQFSEYYVSKNNKQFANNLSGKLACSIKNLTMFYSFTNFLKPKYIFGTKNNNLQVDVNPYYNYQTINGHKMNGYDEIWGIKWSFYF